MLKRWRRRVSGHLFGWLARIEGVEKPILLLTFGLILYRVWKGEGRRRHRQA
jgi:hypothetical protein